MPVESKEGERESVCLRVCACVCAVGIERRLRERTCSIKSYSLSTLSAPILSSTIDPARNERVEGGEQGRDGERRRDRGRRRGKRRGSTGA